MDEHHKYHHEAHERNESGREESSVDIWNEAPGGEQAGVSSDKHKMKIHIHTSSSRHFAPALWLEMLAKVSVALTK